MIFVQHHRNFPIARAEHDFDVQAYQRAQALLGTGDAAHGFDHELLRDLHGMVHDLEQDFVLALKVVIEPAFAEFERGGDVVHGGRVISALLKQPGGGAQNFLPGIDHSLACHRVSW